MPSPFPGMDPYLEGSLWMSAQTQLAVEIARQLTPRLLPKYVALTGQRFVMATPDLTEELAIAATGVYPDAAVTEAMAEAGPVSGWRDGGVAVAAAPLESAITMPEPVPHVTVEIRDAAGRRLVTAVEVLSRTNKVGDGRREYLRKRRRLLLSRAHLIEIDLLRRGARMPMRQPLPPAPYFVLVSRASRRPVAEVWPVGLRQPLPTVPVPLLPGDADVPLDLQQAMAAVYDGFGYAALLDYARPPPVALPPEDATWAQGVLAGRGVSPRP